MMMHDNHRVRRARVSLTDFLDGDQGAALRAFAGCLVNDISKSCPNDCKSRKVRFFILISTSILNMLKLARNTDFKNVGFQQQAAACTYSFFTSL